eukprot:TRINITY_DN10959_c0_g1_i1.p1 TRINITY_DN10959_c0_g1~~TRINITY_DN10959_c0_g1_i1.p1  ORF type:complete len:1115 (-),score=201.21 TRINITY_DN10959_c0_g1_i1:1125-4418(-)
MATSVEGAFAAPLMPPHSRLQTLLRMRGASYERCSSAALRSLQSCSSLNSVMHAPTPFEVAAPSRSASPISFSILYQRTSEVYAKKSWGPFLVRSTRSIAHAQGSAANTGLHSRLSHHQDDSRSAKRISGVAATASSAPASTDLPKTFEFDQEEEKLCDWWESRGFYSPPPGGIEGAAANEETPFVVAMPPPNVTGALHMGHAMFVTLEDIMVRYWRMRGRPTLWVPGTDHAGIATQLVVEKMLAKEGTSRAEVGREEFTRRVWEWKERYGGTIAGQLRRLGASCDWTRERFTLDAQLSRAVMEAFSRLHEKGLIYKGSYMVNWSPNLQTAVSDLEVEYSEEAGLLYFFKYPLAEGDSSGEDDFLPIATTRPETLLGDTAVAVHPEDERFARFVGRRAVVPLSGGRTIPVIADEYVERNFGTGALKITPGHDPNDYAIGQRLGLPTINIMNKDGSLNSNAGPYCGMDRFKAREQLWADLQAAGLALKTQPHTLRVPRSQRGGEVVEPLVSKQWFVRMEALAKPALAAVEDGSLRIIPDRFEKIYTHWLANIRDWCISRQLWWGHRIPVWYPVLPPGEEGDEAGGKDAAEDFIVAVSEEDAYVKARARYGENVRLEQDPDVLDTWFSSALWPFSTLGWPEASAEDLKRFYPTSVLETGHDILFFWVARMVMMGIEFTGVSPFHTIYLHGLVRDAQGRKMSKSLGNVVDPLDTLREYGADALRFTLATGTTPGQDVNLSMERLASNKAFTNKLWNAGKFLLQNLPTREEGGVRALKVGTPEELAKLPLAERWVVSQLHALVDSTRVAYEQYEFGEAGREIYAFFWNDFADWYIEASKTRLYSSMGGGADGEGGEESGRGNSMKLAMAQQVLLYCFDTILRLLHPFMPFVTERLWQALPLDGGEHRAESLMLAPWPAKGLPQDSAAVQHFESLQSLIRGVRNARAEYSVEPARRIAAVIVASPRLQPIVEEELLIVQNLSRLDPAATRICRSVGASESDNAAHLVVQEGLEAYLPLAAMMDVEKEAERLRKQAQKLEDEAAGLKKRLSSPSFVEKAPAAVVQGVREQVAELDEKLSLVRTRLASLPRGEAVLSAAPTTSS